MLNPCFADSSLNEFDPDEPPLLAEPDAARLIGRSTSWLSYHRRADRVRIAAGEPLHGPRWFKSRSTGRCFYRRDDLVAWLNSELLETA